MTGIPTLPDDVKMHDRKKIQFCNLLLSQSISPLRHICCHIGVDVTVVFPVSIRGPNSEISDHCLYEQAEESHSINLHVYT